MKQLRARSPVLAAVDRFIQGTDGVDRTAVLAKLAEMCPAGHAYRLGVSKCVANTVYRLKRSGRFDGGIDLQQIELSRSADSFVKAGRGWFAGMALAQSLRAGIWQQRSDGTIWYANGGGVARKCPPKEHPIENAPASV